jgi:hypothetical protein
MAASIVIGIATWPPIIRPCPDRAPDRYGTSSTRNGATMAADISAINRPLEPRIHIHSPMPAVMSKAITRARAPELSDRPGQRAVQTGSSSIMPAIIATTISR